MNKVFLHKLALQLLVIGALNWGLVALDINLVTILRDQLNNIIGFETNIDKIIYITIAFLCYKSC